MKRVFCLALLIILAGCAQPVRSAVRVSVACSMMAHGADIATSMYASGANLGRELTPTLTPYFDQPLAFASLKMGTAVAANYAVLRLAEPEPTWALALGIGQCVGIGAVAAHNARVIQKATP